MQRITDFFGGIWEGISAFFFSLFKAAFLDDNWKLYLEGIRNTLLMTVMALLIGVAIGVLVALVKYHHLSTGKLKFFNWLANLYTTVIRGTPVMLQLIVIYYIILHAAPREAKVFIAAISFGINSGAYVSEIIRAGILAIDRGQTEASRSLGLSQGQTMRLVVLPQAVRNILPSLFNELIALLKETSVAGYISLNDITFAGDTIRSRDLGLPPLIITALIYLALVAGITHVQKGLERRFATGDRS